jgi:hypothetical protein
MNGHRLANTQIVVSTMILNYPRFGRVGSLNFEPATTAVWDSMKG